MSVEYFMTHIELSSCRTALLRIRREQHWKFLDNDFLRFGQKGLGLVTRLISTRSSISGLLYRCPFLMIHVLALVSS